MGKLTNSMWRLLGSQSTRNQSKSLSLIAEANEQSAWAEGVSEADVAETARALDMGEKKDLAKFLALVREVSDRALDMRAFDVQLQGALRLLEGDVVEMATGEGKTLTAVMPLYLNALAGKDKIDEELEAMKAALKGDGKKED